MSAILARIAPAPRDIGSFSVRRALPAREQRSVGPFVFFDEMGPVTLAAGDGLDVRPHPHIGLATVTYLFEGAITHRDSLGVVQVIRPGDVNWMTAGRGIVHSERTPDELRRTGSRLHGIQTWIALPEAEEETAPAFHHHPAASLPRWEEPRAVLRLIAGTGFGRTAPVRVASSMLYVHAELQPGAHLSVPPEHPERAVYLVTGDLSVADEELTPGTLAVLAPGTPVTLTSRTGAGLMILGGTGLGPRHLWWNFVARTPARIAQAKADWAAGRFPPVPGETEFIPLPEA